MLVKPALTLRTTPEPVETAETVTVVRVAVYLRQSLDAALRKSGDGAPTIDRAETAIRQAVQRQLSACEAWCAARSTPSTVYRVTEVYEDNDKSASRANRVRPAFDRLLADARADQFDLIVSYHLDRLTRTIRDLLPLLDLATQFGVGTTTVSGDLDLTTDMGRMVAGILAVVAQAEVDRKGARQVLANEQRAEQGRPSIGGRRAFGFAVDGMTAVPVEQALIRDAYASVLAGASLTSVARSWNAQGVTTAYGKAFTHNGVRQILLNPRNAGILEQHGVERGRGAWAPVVDSTTFRAAVAVLTVPARRTNTTGGERRNLLTGVGVCGLCNDGTTVVGASAGSGRPLYRCRKSKHLARAVGPVDDYVTETVVELLTRPSAADLLVDRDAPDLDALDAERLAIVARKLAYEQDAALPGPGQPTPAEQRAFRAPLNARLDAIDALTTHRHREKVLGQVVRADDPGAVFTALSLSERQAILGELGTWTIGPGKAGGNPAKRYLTPADYRITFTPGPGVTV